MCNSLKISLVVVQCNTKSRIWILCKWNMFRYVYPYMYVSLLCLLYHVSSFVINIVTYSIRTGVYTQMWHDPIPIGRNPKYHTWSITNTIHNLSRSNVVKPKHWRIQGGARGHAPPEIFEDKIWKIRCY